MAEVRTRSSLLLQRILYEYFTLHAKTFLSDMQSNQNSLIAQLTQADQATLLRHAQAIKLNPGDVLTCSQTKASFIYFPIGGSIALYVASRSKRSSTGLAIGLIGSEGAVGLQAALGLGVGNIQLLVQSAGEAYAVKAERFIKAAKEGRSPPEICH